MATPKPTRNSTTSVDATNAIHDSRIDFHSFRTTFNVELIRHRVDQQVRCVLIGHVIKDVNFNHYGGAGRSLEHLRNVVNLIDIDVSAIRRPPAPARPPRSWSCDLTGEARAQASSPIDPNGPAPQDAETLHKLLSRSWQEDELILMRGRLPQGFSCSPARPPRGSTPRAAVSGLIPINPRVNLAPTS